MERYIKDCVEANEKYVKSDEMLFGFEKGTADFDYKLALEVLFDQARFKIDFKFTKKIYYIPE